MPQTFTTPVGRIVWGHPLTAKPKINMRTKQPVLDKQGQPVQQWVFGLAISKAEFTQTVWPFLQSEAYAAFPTGQIPADFSYKIKDGDGVDSEGKPFADREGYAGNYVLSVSTEAFCPPAYKQENGQYRQIEAHEIKTGDYVAVNLNVKYNGLSAGNGAGLYINPVAIVHVGYGKEIVSQSHNPNEIFAGATFTLPAGASATPLAPSVAAPGMGMPTAPAHAAGLPQANHAPAMPTVSGAYPSNAPQQLGTAAQMPSNAPMNMPGQLPPPARDFVQNAGAAPFPGLPQPR
jgi:hypothetical protein